ncbi:hypothetical protein OXYTRIMIC_236 [Oxytricha trifallax]|uniref:Uncharacterized protein n=1 Tax=Oxytricha trifallax TaxID=1172189 RepID=A0A073HZV0_9SPIT|nr:hypothetical protein OXYTRIMIC_236 [Oxytricha trifallax]
MTTNFDDFSIQNHNINPNIFLNNPILDIDVWQEFDDLDGRLTLSIGVDLAWSLQVDQSPIGLSQGQPTIHSNLLGPKIYCSILDPLVPAEVAQEVGPSLVCWWTQPQQCAEVREVFVVLRLISLNFKLKA